MKVIYKNELRDRIDAVINKASHEGKEIERIELSRKEYLEFYGVLFPGLYYHAIYLLLFREYNK